MSSIVLDRYMRLPQPSNMIQCTYVWIDGTGENLRSKTRTTNFMPTFPKDLPIWSFDGSSAGLADADNSEVFLNPVAVYRDPFLGNNNKLILCETMDSENVPTKTNHRRRCNEIMERARELKPWFGIEQEYTLFSLKGHPLGWPENGELPPPQGPYYCGVGADKMFGRNVVDSHYRACLYAGIKLEGINAEVMPSQWEYQVGVCEGIEMGDDLWMSRYILHKVAEDFGVVVSLDPKPVQGHWNGAGAHANFSTLQMREENGLTHIEKAIHKLSLQHEKHIKLYDPKGGEDNMRRLTGALETSSISKFSSGVADRGCSVRIGTEVVKNKRGYFEDRRPSSNCDPYLVTGAIVETCCLDE